MQTLYRIELCVCCTRLHGKKENTTEGCASVNYFNCYAVDKFAAFVIFVAETFFDKIRLTCLCEKMLAPHIRLSEFRKLAVKMHSHL